MGDRQAVWNWAAAHLQALLFVVKAHWHALVARVGPPLHEAVGWANGYLHAAIAWARPSVQAGLAWLRPYGEAAFAYGLAFAATYWVEIAIPAGLVLATIVTGAWMRRRRRVKATLVDVTLDHDPKTEWLRLGIVVGNFQSHPLVVHSLRVEQPLDARICEHWRAWQPSDAGVKFVAPELALTNEAAIERTIPPHGSAGDYPALAGPWSTADRHADQLRRMFYLLAPGQSTTQPIRLRAVLRCELQTRKARMQDHRLRRLLQPSIHSKVEALAT